MTFALLTLVNRKPNVQLGCVTYSQLLFLVAWSMLDETCKLYLRYNQDYASLRRLKIFAACKILNPVFKVF